MIYLLALNFLAGMIISYFVGYVIGKEKGQYETANKYQADLVERNK